MKNVLLPTTVSQLKERIQQLTPDSKAQWGKMTVYQMLKHCSETTEASLGQKTWKRSFMGRLFGKMILNQLIKGDSLFPKHQPTYPGFVAKGEGDFDMQKAHLISLVEKYLHITSNDLEGRVHPFFGPMTANEWNRLTYKHFDHHLRQFGV